jgi:hypothetical protein
MLLLLRQLLPVDVQRLAVCQGGEAISPARQQNCTGAADVQKRRHAQVKRRNGHCCCVCCAASPGEGSQLLHGWFEEPAHSN